MDESLKLIEAPETTLANRYNARMQRVRREEDGVASLLVYDAQKLIAEAGVGANAEVERYYLAEGGSVYSPLVSQLGSQHCAQKHSWFLFDALGTTLGLAGDAGSLSDTFLYEAFGTSLGRTGTTATPYQYVGGYGYFREAAVGLEQVWWRWLVGSTWASGRQGMQPSGGKGASLHWPVIAQLSGDEMIDEDGNYVGAEDPSVIGDGNGDGEVRTPDDWNASPGERAYGPATGVCPAGGSGVSETVTVVIPLPAPGGCPSSCPAPPPPRDADRPPEWPPKYHWPRPIPGIGDILPPGPWPNPDVFTPRYPLGLGDWIWRPSVGRPSVRWGV